MSLKYFRTHIFNTLTDNCFLSIVNYWSMLSFPRVVQFT